MSQWSKALVWFSNAFSDQKMLVERSIGFHDDALHVLTGIAVHLAAALILRRSLANWLPLAVVFALELANEVNDILIDVWPVPAMQLGEGMKDLLLTVAVPTALFCLARWYPRLLTGRAA